MEAVLKIAFENFAKKVPWLKGKKLKKNVYSLNLNIMKKRLKTLAARYGLLFTWRSCPLVSAYIRVCQIGMQGPKLWAKPRHFCKLDVATSKMAFLDLNLHVLQLVTSNSNNWGRHLWHPLNLVHTFKILLVPKITYQLANFRYQITSVIFIKIKPIGSRSKQPQCPSKLGILCGNLFRTKSINWGRKIGKLPY